MTEPDGETTMQPNVERLRQVCKWLRNHPERHRQASWAFRPPLTDPPLTGTQDSYVWPEKAYPALAVTLEMLDTHAAPACGTALCAAGTAAVMAGAQLLFQQGHVDTMYVRTPDGDRRQVDVFAAQWLGLNFSQASGFFSGGNTIDDLEAMVDVLEAHPTMDGPGMTDAMRPFTPTEGND